jgi:hypothetical protein
MQKGRTTLSGGQLKKWQKNELERGCLHHLMILLANAIFVIADGSDVGGKHRRTHHTIFPGRRMPFQEFVDKYLKLGWLLAGRK